MKLETLKQLRKTMQLWDSSPDEQDDYGNSIIKRALADELDVLSRMVLAELKATSERQQRIEQKIKERGTAKGRPPVVLPEPEVIRQRLKKTTMKALAAELRVSRPTLRNRMRGNYTIRGEVKEYL